MGFSYQMCDTVEQSYVLPGIVYDLYLAYQHATRIECNKIIVITDHSFHNMDQIMVNRIMRGKVDANITTFYETLQINGQLIIFSNLQALENIIRNIGNDATRIFFYYTGHAHHGTALIPKYRHNASYDKTNPAGLHVVDLVDIISPAILAAADNCEVICVTDCCNSNGLRLPYILGITMIVDDLRISTDDEAFVDTVRMKIRLLEDDKLLEENLDFIGRYKLLKLTNWFGGKDIISISASVSGSTTYSSPTGSRFTEELFNHLSNNRIHNYTSLLLIMTTEERNHEDPVPSALQVPNVPNGTPRGYLGKPQIRSSYPESYYIQPWIKQKGTTSIRYEKMIECFTLSQ